jgi:dienelactone hydrolase
MLRPALAALVASVVVSGCSPWLTHFPNARFPNATPGTPHSIPAHLVRPDGPGPFPAVILLHGCHGVTVSTRAWARWFGGLGYVALVVDSWKPRGIPDGCIPEAPDLPSTERFDDTVGALRFLQTRPEVDRARIGVIGWSHGGVFSMAAVNGPTHERARRRGVPVPEPGFRAAVGVYPGGCFSLVHELAVRPLLVLMGSDDDWTVPGPCVEMVQAMRRRGADATIVLYPGAVHYFDVAGQPRVYLAGVTRGNRPGDCCGATVGYDPWAAADARRRVAEFFGRHLAPR